MAELKLRTVTRTQGNNQALKDGTVRPRGLVVDFEEVDPINHTIVVRDELLDAHPDLARELFDAFAQARRLYVERLADGRISHPTPVDELHRRVMEISGNPLPYGIGPNRHVLGELIDAALEQGIIARRPALESLFARGTHDLVA